MKRFVALVALGFFTALAGRGEAAQRLFGTPRSFSIGLSWGETATIASNGPVSVKVTCGGSDDRVLVFAKTRADGASMVGSASHIGTLNKSTPLEERVMYDLWRWASGPEISNGTHRGFVQGPDGEYIGIDGDSLSLGLGTGGFACLVQGMYVKMTP